MLCLSLRSLHPNHMQTPHVVYFSMCGVLTATTQANPSADGDLLPGLIGSIIQRRARLPSLYVNSSAFCPTLLWFLICMWFHWAGECGTLWHKRGKQLQVWKWFGGVIVSMVFSWWLILWSCAAEHVMTGDKMSLFYSLKFDPFLLLLLLLSWRSVIDSIADIPNVESLWRGLVGLFFPIKHLCCWF